MVGPRQFAGGSVTSRFRLFVVVVALGLVAAGCGGAASSSSTSTSNETTTSAAQSTTTLPLSTEELLVQAAESVVLPDGSGSVLVAIVRADGTTDHASVGEADLALDDFFRVGSITKTLTAATVMALVDDGLIDLDSPASKYVSRFPVDDAVTVRHLLQHTSGIPDYTQSDEFFAEVFGDTSRVWTPEDVAALVAGRSDFEPGTLGDYSNTNYVILGTLVEEVTGRAFHEVLRSSVLEASKAGESYLAHFENGTQPVPSYTKRLQSEPVDFEFTSIATAAWASGAVVATADQLAATLGALFGGEVLGDSSLTAMTARGPWETTFYGIPAAYGFGMFRIGDTQFAHDGSIPGFLSAYAHDTSTGATAIWVVTNDGATIPRPSFAYVLERLSEG